MLSFTDHGPCNEQRIPENSYNAEEDFFADFDGVHIRSETPESASRRSHSPAPSFSRLLDMAANHSTNELIYGKSIPYVSPVLTDTTTYYPAPIPMMINLPPKLSRKMSPEGLAIRRPYLASSQEDLLVSKGNRSRPSSMPLPEIHVDEAEHHFEDIELYGTATETLEQILEASTKAPVNAFTDHPFVGGGEAIYDVEDLKRRGSRLPRAPSPSQAPFYKRVSTSVLSFTGLLSNPSMHDSSAEELSPASSSDASEDDQEGYTPKIPLHEAQQQPGTLLTELQQRKAHQRSRNRSAIESFPNGVHSTLLDLDAVAESQSRLRRQKGVILAWHQADQENSDEDVPLGVLYKDQRKVSDRAQYVNDVYSASQVELEHCSGDDEPLSTRRRQLKSKTKSPHSRTASRFGLEVSGLTDASSTAGNEESLGSRLRHLKGKTYSAEFSNELLRQFGSTKEPGELILATHNETLAQRRLRLHSERFAIPNPDRRTKYDR